MLYNCDITVDTRLVKSGGIGTYLKFHLPYICNKYRVVQIGEEVVKGVPFEKCSARLFSLAEQVKMNCLIRKIKPRLHFHQHFTIPLFYDGKLVTVIHDVFHLANPQYLPNKAAGLYARFMLGASVKRSDTVITVSNFQRGEMLKYLSVSADDVTVIYNGVGDMFRRVDVDEMGAVLERNHLPDKYVLYLGNVKPHKNIIRLVKALAKIPDVRLVIVGERRNFITKLTDIDRVIGECNLSNRIHFTGYVDDADLPAIYSGADVLVFPSLYEGFGLPPLEAMACGTPAIASRCQLSDEIYGNAYIPVDPYSIDDIADKIRFALAGGVEIEEYRRRGLKRASMFTWDKASEALLRVFDDVLGQ